MSSKDRYSSSSEKMLHSVVPEFSHRIALNKIGHDTSVDVMVSEEQREKIARRLNVVGINHLEGRFHLMPESDTHIKAEGYISADVVQSCVVTAEPVGEKISEKFQIRFIPLSDIPDDDELDIDTLLAEEVDDVPHDGRAIDLGEALSEQLALCLNPYPRQRGVGLENFVEVTPLEGEEKSENEEKPNPFSVLKKLKEKKR